MLFGFLFVSFQKPEKVVVKLSKLLIFRFLCLKQHLQTIYPVCFHQYPDHILITKLCNSWVEDKLIKTFTTRKVVFKIRNLTRAADICRKDICSYCCYKGGEGEGVLSPLTSLLTSLHLLFIEPGTFFFFDL